MLRSIVKWITGGFLDRVLETIDTKVKNETDRERLRAEVVMEEVRNRPSFLRAGGFWLMLLFAVPLALWFASVCVYSIFWCAGCMFPQDWTVAALPAPLDEWGGWIMLSIFGTAAVLGRK